MVCYGNADLQFLRIRKCRI